MTAPDALTAAASKRRVWFLRAEWAGICNAMADGYWHGTEADALDRIAAIKAELESMGVER